MQVHVGSAKDMGKRFVSAWNRAVAGEDVDERHVTFLSLEEMLTALSPKRLELLRHLHRDGAENVKALAVALNQDYKRVYEDVAILEKAGLIVREEGRLDAPWDSLSAEVPL
jgi:predicted transcriptional regulator